MTDKPLPRREAWLLARRKKRRRVLLWQVGLLLALFGLSMMVAVSDGSVLKGLILGLVGAVVAFFLQWGIYVLVGSAISGSDTISLITVLPFQPMALRVLGVFVLTGFVIGAGGSVLAIRKFLQV